MQGDQFESTEDEMRSRIQMSRNPFEVIRHDKNASFNPAFRINFKKEHTVEHYFRVKPMGMIMDTERLKEYAKGD
jgi:hypothetical protein